MGVSASRRAHGFTMIMGIDMKCEDMADVGQRQQAPALDGALAIAGVEHPLVDVRRIGDRRIETEVAGRKAGLKQLTHAKDLERIMLKVEKT